MTDYKDNIGNYFAALGKQRDSVSSDLDSTFSTNTYNCFPETLKTKISSAYRTIIHIHDERKNSYANVIAVCPKVLSFGFKNKWATIDPFKLSGGEWVQAGIQTFGAENYSGPLDREVSTIHYWQGGSPIKMKLTVQLYAESYRDVEEKIFQPLKVLSNLAQPSTSSGGKLIQPGPSPFKFTIKYRGIKLKEIQTREKGTDKVLKSEYKEVVNKEDGTALYTNYELSAGKGVQTDIKIGDWFYLTDVLVDSVNINIPMSLAKHYRYTTGTTVQEEQNIGNAQETKATTKKNNDKRISELDKWTNDNNEQIKTLSADKEAMVTTRSTLKTINNDIATTQGDIDKKTVDLDMYSKNEAKFTQQAKEYNTKALVSGSLSEAANNLSTSISYSQLATKAGTSAKNCQSDLNTLNTKMQSLQADKMSTETKLKSYTDKYGSEEKIQRRIDNLEAENKDYSDEKKRLNRETADAEAKQDNIIKTSNNRLNSDAIARPFMATIEMDISTKYQTTQEDFNKMLSGIPNNKQFIDWDLTDSKFGSATADYLSRLSFIDAKDTGGKVTEIVYEEQKKSNVTKAHDAVKNAKKK